MTESKRSSVYLDYAASTPLDPSVAACMRSFEDTHFANAFSSHRDGREVKRILEEARFGIAKHLGVQAHECHFTNGATDASSRAIRGVVEAMIEKGCAYSDLHIVMSAIEHSSVRSCVEALGRRGVSVSLVPVSKDGIVDVLALQNILRPNTILVAVMLVNNELGTIQPIKEIAKVIREYALTHTERLGILNGREPILFVDASQAPISIAVSPQELSADMLILDAQKIYGPKRTGLLYVRSNTPWTSLCGMFGRIPREGTPDVAGVLGMCRAYDVVIERRDADMRRFQELKAYFVSQLKERFKNVIINGSLAESVPHILNVTFPGIDGEFLAAQLDVKGVAVAVKSACLSQGGEGSYVIHAIAPERANESTRFSFGRATTTDDIDYVVSVLADIVRK